MAKQSILICSKLLAEQGLTIAFAESATAGWLCSEFALSPDSGKILKGAIVSYDASLKNKILNVPQEVIDQYTPESAEVTREMAIRLSTVIPSSVQVAVTGLTTPGGSETPEKPVGTMFVHLVVNGVEYPFRKQFQGSCEAVIQQTIEATAQLIIKAIS